jgi:hypothetical protein
VIGVRLAFGIALGSVWLFAAIASAQSCVPSAAGAFAMDVRVSPRAGDACLMIVTVFEGTSCVHERERWSAELGCSESRRLRVTDAGRLVSILAPRASNPRWPIVRIFSSVSDSVRRVSLRLVDLPGGTALHGPVRVTFVGDELVMTARDGTHSVAIGTVETLTPGSL